MFIQDARMDFFTWHNVFWCLVNFLAQGIEKKECVWKAVGYRPSVNLSEPIIKNKMHDSQSGGLGGKYHEREKGIFGSASRAGEEAPRGE